MDAIRTESSRIERCETLHGEVGAPKYARMPQLLLGEAPCGTGYTLLWA